MVIEPVIGGEDRIAIGFEGCAMPQVRTRLGHQRDLRAEVA